MEGVVVVSVLTGLVEKACGILELIYFTIFDSVFDW